MQQIAGNAGKIIGGYAFLTAERNKYPDDFGLK